MLLKRVKRTIEKYRMLDDGDRVLAAVSGGPDSVALLYVLFSMADKYNLSISVAHLNHMLRGKDADEDARFVEKLSKKLGLPFFSERKNVRSFMKKTHLSPEEAARKVRYNFFERVGKSGNFDKVALGQTVDDQAETVLLAVIRGTGLAGLSGIPPVRALGKSGIKVIRPLIETLRSEIEKYLRAKGITPRLDASNLEPVYLRNKIRLELLPLIAGKYNPNIKLSLAGLAGILREDNQFLVEETKKLIPEVLDNVDAKWSFSGSGRAKQALPLQRGRNCKKVEISLQKIRSVPLALQQRLVREAINRVSRNMRPLSLVHWDEIHKLLNYGRTNSYLNLPDGIVVKRERRSLVITKAKVLLQRV